MVSVVPDEDAGEVEFGLVGEGEFVGSCCQAAPLLESVDVPLVGVPLLVGPAVEAGWASASEAPSQAVADLVGRLRDDRANAWTLPGG